MSKNLAKSRGSGELLFVSCALPAGRQVAKSVPLRLVVFIFLTISVFLLLASPALALDSLVPCGRVGQPACTTCDALVLGKNISDFILFYLVPALSSLFFIYAGFMILLGGGIPAQVAKGQNIFRTTVYGLLIIFLSWMIVNTVLRTVAGDENIAENWWKLECREIITTGTNGGGGSGGNKKYACQNNQCAESISGTFTEPTCNNSCSTASTTPVTLTTTPTTIQACNVPPGTLATDPGLANCQKLTISLSGLTLGLNYRLSELKTGTRQPQYDNLPAVEGVTDVFEILFYNNEDGQWSIHLENADTGTRVSNQVSVIVTPVSVTSTITISTANFPNGNISTPYSQTLAATGGQTPYAWTKTGGNLPAGLSLNPEGTITGQPTAAGTATFTVKVEDSSTPKKSATKQLGIQVISGAISSVSIASSAPTIRITTPPTSLTFTGTNLPLNTNVTAVMTKNGTNQPNQNFSTGSTGSLSAVTFRADPGDEGNWTLKVRMPDGRESNTVNFIVLPPVGTITNISISTTSLPNGNTSQPYLQTLAATGGQTPYAWTKTGGNLPAGLSLNPEGTITGQPTAAGTATFTVKVEDSSTPKKSATKQLGIQVISGAISSVCRDAGVNLCQGSTACAINACNQYSAAIQSAAAPTPINGLNTAAMIRAIMFNESSCNIAARNLSLIAQGKEGSYGLMQMQPSTANRFKSQCAITANITGDWLNNPANAQASICLAAKFIRSIANGTCSINPRNIAAGYNGGVSACDQSRDCLNERSCDNSAVRRWECLYDNTQHTVCNVGYNETRTYAPKVAACYNVNK